VIQGGEGGQVVSTELASAAPGPVEKSQGIRFKGWGTGSEDEIRAELRAGRPVVLEVPGHYIAAVGLDGDQIMINDPFYAERTTLASYTGRVRSARLFEPGTDMRSLMVTVPANVRVELKDARGRRVGTLGGDTPEAAQQSAVAEIPGAVYRFEEAWRDPTCTERAPPPGSGTATIFIPMPEKGIYTVEVIDPKGKRTDAAVYVSDVNGKRKLEPHEGGGDLTFEVDYDPGQTQTTTTDPATPTPSPTATTPPTATTAPATAAPGRPTATTPPTATATPSPTPIPVTIPTFTVSLDEVNQESPCSITVSWEATGPPDTKVYLYRANGESVGTDPSNRVYETGPGEDSYDEPFKPGIRTYRLQAVARNGSALKAPVTANPICIDAFYTSDKCNQLVGWQVSGGPQGARYTLFRRNSGTTQWTAIRNGTVVYGQPMSINEDLGSSITYEYTLQVAVQSRLVTTNPILERWDNSGGCIG
jgi:hypothetical protein